MNQEDTFPPDIYQEEYNEFHENEKLETRDDIDIDKKPPKKGVFNPNASDSDLLKKARHMSENCMQIAEGELDNYKQEGIIDNNNNNNPEENNKRKTAILEKLSLICQKVSNLKVETSNDSNNNNLFFELHAKLDGAMQILDKLECPQCYISDKIIDNNPHNSLIFRASEDDLDYEMEYLNLKFSPDSVVLNEKCWKKQVLKYVEPAIGEKIWNLLYRASRDGWSVPAFCSKITNLNSPVLCVIKTRNGSIFGAFTTKKWNCNGLWINDTNSFMFSLINTQNPSRGPVKYHCFKPDYSFRCGNQLININSGWLFSFGFNDFSLQLIFFLIFFHFF